MTDLYKQKEKEYKEALGEIPKELDSWVTTMLRVAAKKYMDEAYSGGSTDGGAGRYLEYVRGYLDGYGAGQKKSFSIV